MSLFNHSLKKGLSHLAARISAKSALYKSAKTTALLGSLILAGKYGHSLIKKKIDRSLAENQNNAITEIKTAFSKSIKKLILECLLRWVLYLSLILLAYLAAQTFHLRKDVLVAFVILGIYSFYIIKAIRVCRWYISFCLQNGLIFNPAQIIRAYLHRTILNRVEMARRGLSLPKKLAMNFFGPANEKIARDITASSLQSTDLRREAMIRIALWIGGWIIYALVYEKLFLYVTNIDFKAFWEPVIWPFYIIFKLLAAQHGA